MSTINYVPNAAAEQALVQTTACEP